MDTLEKAFGHILQQMRRKKGLSQEELGLKSGYHRTYISLLERGHKCPSLRSLFGLAEALDVEPTFIIEHLQKIVTKCQQPPENTPDRENS